MSASAVRPVAPVSVLAVADSDSYLKWSAATVAAMPPHWLTEQWLVRSPITPSPEQRRAASTRPPTVASVAALGRRLDRDPPDVVLLACTGPVVHHLLGTAAFTRPDRPVAVTGLPGISVPASTRAVQLRAGCDLFVVHSLVEQRQFGALMPQLAPGTEVGLARLPFLAGLSAPGGSDLVFAAQAKFPADRDDRLAVLRALARTSGTYRPVVKLRGAVGEQQTHHEALPYPVLWQELVRSGAVEPGAVTFSTGPMATALEHAAGFATVSSTAALEAVDAGVPLLVLDDFGVSGDLVNAVFEGSGCLGGLDDLVAGRFRQPRADWRTDNYFHPASQADWLARLDELVRRREGSGLPPVRRTPLTRRRRWRTAARLHAPTAARLVGQASRRVRPTPAPQH